MQTERQLANLRSFGHDQDREAARINGTVGGIKSGEVRRRRKNLREAVKWLLQEDSILNDNNAKELLAEQGIDNPSNAEVLMLIALKKAATGDVEALRFIRDTAGEAPSNRVELSGDMERPIATMDLRTMSEAELLRIAEAHVEDGE